MSDLKSQLIKLGSTNPELRPHIRKILSSQMKFVTITNGFRLTRDKDVFAEAIEVSDNRWEARVYVGQGVSWKKKLHGDLNKVKKDLQQELWEVDSYGY